MLSEAFIAFVEHLDPREREIVSAKRAESVQESIRSRSGADTKKRLADGVDRLAGSW